MKKSTRSLFTCLCLAVLIASMATMVFAASSSFSSKFVDSNQWTSITNCRKQTTTSTADLKITALYKADGSTSDYWRIYAKASSIGSKTYVEKGTYYPINIPDDYRAAGSYVTLYLMGHSPSLDCRASGEWVVH